MAAVLSISSTSTKTTASPTPSAPLADHAAQDFQISAGETIRRLNMAKEAMDRTRNRRLMLNIANLSPGNTNGTIFWHRLTKDITTPMKMLYDASATNSNGLLDVMYHLCVEYQTCTYISQNSINKYYICELNKTIGKTHIPDSQEDWNKLLVFTQSLIHSKKMDGRHVNAHKRSRTKIYQGASSIMHDQLMKDMVNNNQQSLGVLAGCFVWMLETKNMNREMVADHSNSQGYTTRYNNSTLLCRNLPPQPRAQTVTSSTLEVTSSDESEEPIIQEEEDVVDNWEDLLV